MKTFTSLLIACSLALAGAALAQPPEEQQSPSKKKRAAQKTQATEAQPGAKPQQRPAKQPGAMKEHGAMSQPGAASQPGARKGRKGRENQESANAPGTNVSGQPTDGAPSEPGAAKGRKGRAKSETEGQTGADVSGQPAGAAAPGAKQEAEQGRQGKKGRGAHATTSGAPAAAPGAAAGQQNAQANVAGGKKAKLDPQKVQQIKTQHASFRAQPKPQQVQPVTFNQNYRIQGSEHWQGTHYEVFRSYRPEWHDAGWYHSHYPNVTLIAGGYYFFNAGYWYPAWGYNPSAQYYAYDGPIYVGQRAQPPDQVIADVQAVLQEMGYYRGEVDGLLGPLTREALTAYQADNGLITTAAIDQPTLDSLGMG